MKWSADYADYTDLGISHRHTQTHTDVLGLATDTHGLTQTFSRTTPVKWSFGISRGRLARIKMVIASRKDRGQMSEDGKGQKSDVRGQMSEDGKGQKSDVRCQMSEVRCQRSEIRDQGKTDVRDRNG